MHGDMYVRVFSSRTEKVMDKPNILVIMTDQHSKNFLGCYGNEIVRTKNLDRLAEEGMRFTAAYCAAPLCVPSRMSFMTCCTPSENEVWANSHILSSDRPTWAHLMSVSGYDTALIGRMHFNGPDQRHGFQERPIGEPSAGLLGTPVKGGPPWTKFSSATSGQCRESVEVAGRGNTFYQWADEERTKTCIQWLKDRADNKGDKPFAAVLGYTLPHCPFVAKKELFDYYYPITDIPDADEKLPATQERFRKIRQISHPDLPEERIRVARAAYYGLCEHIDTLIGEVLNTLDETGLSENTIVVYTSDHGEMAGEHNMWWKSNYYEASAGVPLIIRWPGRVEENSVCDRVVSLMDLGVTFGDIANAAFDYSVSGRSLLKILTEGNDPHWENITFSELVDVRGGIFPSRMVRKDNWKLWVFHDEEELPLSLFNLDEDPHELSDLARDEKYKPVIDELLQLVYKDWDPVGAGEKTKRKNQYYDLLYKWGSIIKPDAPDAIVLPSADYEDDVELL